MYPVLFQWNDLIVYSYPLFMGIAWGISFHLTWNLIRERNVVPLSEFILFFVGIFLSAWLGAKLTFLLTSGNDLSQELGVYSSHFWLGGGFVFYGGLIGAIIFVLFFCFLLKRFPSDQLHLLIPGICFGHAIGRVGCFLAGCCFGKICELPWSFYMHGHHRHPVQLYEFFILIFIGTWSLIFIKRNVKGSAILYFYIFTYSISRFLLEFLRGDTIRGGVSIFSSSQLISLGVVAGGILMLVLRKYFIR